MQYNYSYQAARWYCGYLSLFLSLGLLSGMIFDRIRIDESRTVLLK
jgi:hypothetical protein